MYIAILFLFAFTQQESTVDKFEIAIVKQDAKVVTDLCDSFVEIETNKEDKVTSKSQAGSIIKDFFEAYPVKTFEYIHQGKSPGGAQYAIGTYVSKQGDQFRVVIKMKSVGGKLLLEAIKFSPE